MQHRRPAQGFTELDLQSHQVEQAPAALELDEEIHVAVRSRVAPGDRAEDSGVDDAMLAHRRLSLATEGLKGGTHT